MSHSSTQTIILATGLQSSGSTLLSWCFLQRADMNGVLDGDTDLIPLLPLAASSSLAWYKTTISCFTLQEQMACLEDEGYTVLPLLMVRDVRKVWASLMHKHYGRNGVTAEDPPLRLRFRRFLESWQYAMAHQLPVVKYETFIEQPEKVLKELCVKLGLPWDEAMLNWPKPAGQISNTRHGNATFRESDKGGLKAAIRPPAKAQEITLHGEDLDWLNQYFTRFNRKMDYPAELLRVIRLPGRLTPDWQASRRCKWRLQQKPLRYLLSKFGLSSHSSRPE